MKIKFAVITGLLAASATLFGSSAIAGGVQWSVNVGVPAYPAYPAYPVVAPMPPTVVYAPPPPVVYTPPPRVVYGPPQPYYGPGVGVVGYGPYYGGRPYGHRHHHPRRGDWD